MDIVDHVEEEGLVVGLLRRQQGGTGTPRKRPDEDSVVEVVGAGAGKDLQVQVNEGYPSTKDVVLDVEGEEDDNEGALEETDSWDISGVRGFSGNERQQEEVQDAGETEYDVENVIKKQNTHNLFCPNCKSCITRSVILHRKGDTEEEEELLCVSCLSFIFPRGKPWGRTSGDGPSLKPGDTKLGKTTAAEEPRTIPADISDPLITNKRIGHQNRNGDSVSTNSVSSTKPTTNSTEDVVKSAMDSDKKVAAIVNGSSAAGQQLIDYIDDLSDPSAKTPRDAIIKPTDDVMVDMKGSDVKGAAPRDDFQPSPTPASETDQAQELDIIKSIVYGGLIESITSLGIVSSAAGGGASTLNILALALANLFGGLFVIAHNLRELKNQQPSTAATSETPDRYTELLGDRQRILLHATIVILSFIVFGAVAPVTYAFSFRKSDSRDYKLAAVAGASLFCILLLATGKAYVRRPSKPNFKTILYYLGTGVAASGISFLLGELFDYLLQKLGWFSSTASVSGPWLVSGPTQYGTASY